MKKLKHIGVWVLIACWVATAIVAVLPHWHNGTETQTHHICWICRLQAATPLPALAISLVLHASVLLFTLTLVVQPLIPAVFWPPQAGRAPPVVA